MLTTRWEVARVQTGHGIKEDDEKLANLLAAGWEPYAVTTNGAGGYAYHLRIQRQHHYDGNTDGD